MPSVRTFVISDDQVDIVRNLIGEVHRECWCTDDEYWNGYKWCIDWTPPDPEMICQRGYDLAARVNGHCVIWGCSPGLGYCEEWPRHDSLYVAEAMPSPDPTDAYGWQDYDSLHNEAGRLWRHAASNLEVEIMLHHRSGDDTHLKLMAEEVRRLHSLI